MKYLFISALLSVCTVQAWAQQEKKEATVKIVIIENGKEKVIERKFSDIDQADKEIKKLSDSLDVNISTSNGKNKIVRVDVNKALVKPLEALREALKVPYNAACEFFAMATAQRTL